MLITHSHVEIFLGMYNPYIWPCVALWAFDRFLRICRIAYLNLSACKGTATYNAESNVIRINVPHRKLSNPGPGTYCFVYILNGLKLWESHPFTIASWTNTTSESEKGSLPQNTCTFAVRPHDSFTARLRDQILRRNDTESSTGESGSQIRVVMEGPYGVSHSTQDFDSALMIIGGSGISVALAHVRALCEALAKKDPVALRKVHLVWAVRDIALFQDHFDHEISPLWLNGPDSLASKINVQLSLYVTGTGPGQKIQNVQSRSTSPTDSTRSDGLLEKSELGPTAAHVSHVNDKTGPSVAVGKVAAELDEKISFFSHRPDVHDIVVTAAQAEAVNGRRMAVVSCGPARMADDARAGVVAALGKRCEGVEFLPETFGW